MSRLVVAMTGGSVLLEESDGAFALPEELPADALLEDEEFSFADGEDEYRAVALKEGSAASGLKAVGVRESWSLLGERVYAAVGKAGELLHWGRHSRYCGRCGGKMERSTEISKRCPQCGYEMFAPVAPAVIVLVRRGDEALLVHARTFRKPFFGLVAGFVETGESLEDCVRREVREETALEVDNVRYFGSQAWPFPAQIMIGFTADYKSGELRFADGELTEGGFFSRDRLPLLPGYPSIARRMIDSWAGASSEE